MMYKCLSLYWIFHSTTNTWTSHYKAIVWLDSNEFVKYVGVSKCYGCFVKLYPGQAHWQGESVLENHKQQVEVFVEIDD